MPSIPPAAAMELRYYVEVFNIDSPAPTDTALASAFSPAPLGSQQLVRSALLTRTTQRLSDAMSGGRGLEIFGLPATLPVLARTQNRAVRELHAADWPCLACCPAHKVGEPFGLHLLIRSCPPSRGPASAGRS